MNHRESQPGHLGYATHAARHRKRHLEPCSPNPYHQLQTAPDHTSGTRRRSAIAGHSTSLRPFHSEADYLSRLSSLKPSSQRTANVTNSPGWDPVGDDDALYIQSDDTHLRDLAAAASQRSSSSTRSGRLDQHALLQARKRKRTNATFDRSQTAPRPSTASQSSRPPLKHDAEGCSNCRSNASTCWFKKSKSIILSDGTEAWGEEKLCNPCGIHWNKNGYHRSVRPKTAAPKQIPQQPPAIIPTRSTSSRTRRSCPADFPPGLSSPTAFHSTLRTRPPSRGRSPSQLTLAAEREARILKKNLAKANAKSNALKHRKHVPKSGYISEEEDELFNNPAVSPPVPHPRSTKRGSRKAARSVSLKHDSAASAGNLSTRESLPSSVSHDVASASHHLNYSPIPAPIPFPEETQAFDSFLNQYLSSQSVPHFEPLQKENMFMSPPRTPPPNAHIPTTSSHSPLRDSPGHLCDLNHILSPSFLNSSPNSLLRRLDSQKSETSNDAFNLSASFLPDYPPGVPEKVFSPGCFLPSKSSPLPPVAEPSKKSSPNPPLAGSVGLLDAHLTSSSLERSHKQFIFSPSRF
ncbi:hypothetical protein PCANC_21164 [Puccinia coronata f. sp. avenae]|uniref:GATA-type domain-containing protein n=1 Tax=Puccinia coronata f. sp. avenae TaxID=200324 RepID=A0A2N5SSW6_9BASI|nr:hypothetical protein PCANC_21164 [Puccinia coronata f. sp. avenae]PLW38244.1 hypothetical protein PCASD_19200 [Puccinia coronata f. sp. avenae]